MDLRERGSRERVRHPWERARARALQQIVSCWGRPCARVLDLGCGDAFPGSQLADTLGADTLVGVDVNFSREEAAALSSADGKVRYYQRLEQVRERPFDLILLLDVIEHVDDDRALVGRLVSEQAAPRALVLITAPAFALLFSDHDRFLQHRRRYSLDQLTQVCAAGGLQLIASGYLFCSLLLPRFFFSRIERWLPLRGPGLGASAWGRWPLVAQLIEGGLRLDNALLLSLRRQGVTLPGLSVWALCQKPG